MDKDHPRRAGKSLGYAYKSLRIGITPAWAGKSSGLGGHVRICQDHPRVGGEKTLYSGMQRVVLGSPPHGRGKAVKFRCTCGLQRITPA